jgi:hypothetical protein
MNRTLLFAYHLVAGLSDASTGALLVIAPAAALQMMRLSIPTFSFPLLSFIGAFVFAVGLSYLYGVLLLRRGGCSSRLEALWIVTAFLRGSVASYVTMAVLSGQLAAGWIVVAFVDAACVAIQAAGLRLGWLSHA